MAHRSSAGVIRARFDGAREWTNPLVVNFIDSLRGGDYCPVTIDGKTLEGKAGRICEEMTGTLAPRVGRGPQPPFRIRRSTSLATRDMTDGAKRLPIHEAHASAPTGTTASLRRMARRMDRPTSSGG